MSEESKKKNGLTDEEQAAEQEVTVDENELPDVEQLQQELAQGKDQFLRLAAEFENFKKRMERERETLIKYAGENILRELLPTLDNFDRALEQGEAEAGDPQQKLDALLEGLALTRKGLLSTLEKFEVVPLDSVGKPFDPNEHEAMSMGTSETVPENHVMQEFVKGYRFRDRLLRPAKVVVSQGDK